MSDANLLFRLLAEFAPDALLAVDDGGAIAYANGYAHTLFGYEPGALVGLSVERLIPPASRDAHVAHRRRYAAEPRLREMGGRDRPLYGLRRDGTQFRAEVRLSPVVLDARRMTAAAIRDATEHDRVMEIARTARDAAEKANEAKSRFVAAVSHDLRQPLQALRATNAVLQRQVADPAVQAVLRQEKQSLDSMVDLLNALLNLSKLESGTIALRIADVPLGPLLNDLRQQFADAAAAKGLRLEVDACEGVTISTDRALFFDLLQNLIGNAIRYTDTGCVRVSWRQAGDHRVAVDVADTGIGIAAELLPKIWDDFYQAAGSTGAVHRGGAGLGLAIVRRVAELLRADVQVKSSVGQGSCFTVLAPRLQERALAGDALATAATPATGGGRNIIFVEDDEAVRAATSMYLKLDGYKVHGVGSLSELDELLEDFAEPPAIVVSDFRLKRNETGSEAIARVRAKFGASLPAIVLTGDVSSVPADAFKGTRTRLLDKPIDVVALTGVIGELLNA